jgi:hypothetical protein
MFESNILNVSVNGQGVVSRRSILRGIGLGTAGLAGLSFPDLMAVHADELRKRQMACILLWMGGPSPRASPASRSRTTSPGSPR